jgi:erythromycin esterase
MRGRTILWSAAALALILYALPALAAEPPDERVRWLTDNTLVIRSIEPGDEDFSDLLPLVPILGNVRAVQIGEASHGDGATFLAKARLIRFLHQKMGFDVIAWEAGIADVPFLDAALRTDVPLPEAATQALYGIWSRTREVMFTLEYVRSSWRTPRPIQIVGFDSRISIPKNRSERWPAAVFDFFDRLDPKLISPQERADLAAMAVGLVPADYYEKPGPRQYNRELPKRLVATIETRRAELLVYWPPRQIDYIRQSLLSLMGMDRALAGNAMEPGPEGYSRDTAMAENLLWWLNGPLKDRKVIIWAHNYHVMKGFLNQASEEQARASGRSQAGPMGRFLDASLGREMYTIAFLSHHGRSGWVNEEPRDLPAAGFDSLQTLFHATGRPYLFMDLRRLPADHWLRDERTATFNEYEPMALEWARLYDGVFFIDEQKPPTKVE